MDTMWCSEPRSGNNGTTYLDELLHALADGGIVDVGGLLCGKIGELGLRNGLRVGSNVGSGHSGDATSTASRRSRELQESARVVFGVDLGHGTAIAD